MNKVHKTKAGKAAMPLSVVILAAGQGKRMNSDLPKVLQPLAGQPLLRHVVDTAMALQPAAVHVVYGHGGEQVRAAFQADALHWALQAEQKGTGHAVQQAMPAIPDDHLVLVLYGDVPLLQAATLSALLQLAADGRLALLTVALADPDGYGRVLRDRRGSVKAIVEQKDASAAQLRIREGNTGVLAVAAPLLRRWLKRLRSDNAQGEYYLTDIVAMAVKDRVAVRSLVAATESEVLGVNNRLQLAQLEAVLRSRRAAAAMHAGATLVDPARFDQRGELVLGRDVFIDADVLFEGRVVLGDRVRIGPHCVLRDMTVGADTHVVSHCVLEQSEVGSGCSIGPLRAPAAGRKTRRRCAYRQFCRGEEQQHRQGLEGQPPDLPGRCHSRGRRECGSRQHLLQLRRRQQVAHRHRRRRIHRFGQHAGGAGHDRRKCHHRRRLHDHQGCACGQADPGAIQAGDHRRLEASGEAASLAGDFPQAVAASNAGSGTMRD